MENSMGFGMALLMFGARCEVEECVHLWEGVLSSPRTLLTMDGALKLCDVGRCQGPVRSAVWALCERLSSTDLVSSMLLYDALIKDTAHEPDCHAHVRAAAAVRATVVAALGGKMSSTSSTSSKQGLEEEEGEEEVRWLWLAVRVVGAGEGGLLCEEEEVETRAIACLERLVRRGAAALRFSHAADTHVNRGDGLSAQKNSGQNAGGKESKEGRRTKEEREEKGAMREVQEAALEMEREAQLKALTMSCSRMHDKAALLVEATRALLAVSQALLLASQHSGAARSASRYKAASKAGGKASTDSRQEVQAQAASAFAAALEVVHVLLDVVPHYAPTVEFLLEFVEMEEEADLGTAEMSLSQSISFDMAYTNLRMNLLTADEKLRIATLRLWLHLLPEIEHDIEEGAGYDLFGVDPQRATFEVMLGVEEAPMDAVNGKTRILRLQQLQTAVESNKIPLHLRSCLLAFYVGQLRCRFTLPWKQVREGLQTMAQHMPEHMWPGLLAHLHISAGSVNFSALSPHPLPVLEFVTVEGWEEEGGGDEAEEVVEGKSKERKGKAAKKVAKVPTAVVMDLRLVSPLQRLHERLITTVKAHHFSGTPQLDVKVQLLTTAASDAKYLQNHSKYFVEQFLNFLALQYDPLFTEDQEALEPEDVTALGLSSRATHADALSLEEHIALKAAGKKSRFEVLPEGAHVRGAAQGDVTMGVVKMGRSDATRVLTGFLEVFSNMSSAQPLYQNEILRRVFHALLVKTNNQVQLLSLRGLYLWKPLDLMPYKQQLENLIDDEKYRDELTFFTVDDEHGQVKEAHRQGLVPVLSRILYAKVVQRKVQGARTSLAQRRATVLAFFAGLRQDEFRELVSILFRPFRTLSAFVEGATGGAEWEERDAAVLAALNTKKLLGFLNTLKDLVDQVGHLLTAHLPQITATLLALVAHVFRSGSVCEVAEEGADDDKTGEYDGDDDKTAEYKDKLFKKLRGLCLRRVTDVVTKFKTSDFADFMPRLLETLKPRIVRLPLENTQSPVGLLETFHEMAYNDTLAPHLFTYPEILPAIFGCMSAPKAAFLVRRTSLEVADVLVRQAETLGQQKGMSSHMSVLLHHVYLHLKVLVDKGGPSQAGDLQAQVRELNLLRLQFNLLAQLSKYTCTPEQAQQLLDLLIPFLGNRKKFGNVSASEEARRFILETCANLVKLVHDSNIYVAPAARQLLPVMAQATRDAACDFIVAIGKPLQKVAQYVLEFSAMSVKRLDEYDFDRRLAAYSACCQPAFLASLSAHHVRVLAAQSMHDVRDEDVSIRNHGIKLLCLIMGCIKTAAAGKGGAATLKGGGGLGGGGR